MRLNHLMLMIILSSVLTLPILNVFGPQSAYGLALQISRNTALALKYVPYLIVFALGDYPYSIN